MPDLEWFPKPFGPGDTDGTGQQRSLGQPKYSPHEVLIREMAQNSWDARLKGGTPPTFEMRLRTLGASEVDVLRWNVFRGVAPNLGLTEALNEDRVQVIEISDRGTKGLGGTTRNDLEFDPDDPRDYADFVLTVGAPPDMTGGGTYGYGKTAAYSASSCHTILIWSRSRNHVTGEVDTRFIASAMGPSFVENQRMYTGRQWWGIKVEGPEGDRIEPITGDSADRLGRALYERHFDDDETGTSLLIIAPRSLETSENNPTQSTVECWRRAVTQHLWPKLAQDQPSARRMTINLFDHGDPFPSPDPNRPSRVLSALQLCLEAIRSAQASEQAENPLVRLLEVRSLSPAQLLGHLALMRTGPVPDEDPLRCVADTVTFMRSEAELVVMTKPYGGGVSDLEHWVGVFKPLPDFEGAFAQAEPQAHDTWHYQSLQDPTAKSIVRRAMNKVSEAMKEYLKTPPVEITGSGAISTGALSESLSGLVGGTDGSLPQGVRRRSTRASSKPKARIKISLGGVPQHYPPDATSGRQLLQLPLLLSTTSPARISPSRLVIAVEGSSIPAADEVKLERWEFDGRSSEGDTALVEGGLIDAFISHPAGTAVQVDFKAELAE